MNHAHNTSESRRTQAALATIIATLLTAAGCAVGPDYHPPVITTAMRTWTPVAATPVATTTDAAAAPADRWWETFHDPELDGLVRRALVSSPDLAIAAQRVREARAGLQFAAGGELPQAGVDAGKMEYRRTGPLNTIYRGSYATYQAGFDASWELDLWGGARRAVEAAGAALQASEEDDRGARLALAAEVARDYVDLRATQRRLAIARTNLDLQERTLALTRQRLHAGVAGELDVFRAEALAANTRASLPLLEDGINQLIHRLGVLLGDEPEALVGELAAAEPIPTPPARVAVGLPADLLRRRPDVRAAERSLAAATAGIGVAKAQLYPHLGLAGTLGFVGTGTVGLFDYSSRYFSLGPGLHWSIFNAGRVRAQVEAASARSEEAYAAYRKVVLGALADADNALGAFDAEQRRHGALVDAAGAARQSVATASELYRQGVTDFLSVIDAERSLAAADDNLAQSDRAVSTDLIALYKSLGGGGPVPGAVPSHGAQS